MAADGLSCSCGARVVGPPLVEPDYLLPSIGRALIAMILAVIGIGAFVWKWLLVVTLLAVVLSLRAWRSAQRDPRRFGGQRLAATALAISLLLVIGVTGYVLTGIPKYLRTNVEKERAAARAQLYQVAIKLRQYKRLHGSYPPSLSALQILSPQSLVFKDRWDNTLRYQATTELAAESGPATDNLVMTQEVERANVIGFNQYQLVSPGPDNKLGTADDLVMADDVIVAPSQVRIQPVDSDIDTND
jgi:type II secretory pathway pseudopilin PulG